MKLFRGYVRQGLRASVWALLLGFAASAMAAPWTLQGLMQELARHRGGSAAFTETKTIALLDKPVESSGVLRFAAPDFLEMRTLKPKAQDVILFGNRVSAEIDGRQHSFDLRDHPEAAGLVRGLRATLNGDAEALQRAYNVTFAGTRAHWTLGLTPRDAAAQIREVRIEGHDDLIDTIAIVQADGDSSLMRLRALPQP